MCDELNVYHHELRPGEYAEFYLKFEADKVIADKDAEIARLKAVRKVHVEAIASMGAGLLQDGEEIRRLRRALWLARANNARNSYLKWNLFANFESEDKLFTIDEYDETPGVTDFSTLRTYAEWCKVWQNVGRKCLKKVEEYQ